ncbi:translation initiation factor IF-3, partial [Mycobacterium sp. ITM-2017-0098]
VLAPHRGAKTRAKAAHDADVPAAQRASAPAAEAPTDTPQN